MIGDRIKNLRKKKGYSITELAKQAEVSKSYLSQIERNLQTNPSLLFINKIATTLDTTIDFLFEKENFEGTGLNELDDEWKLLVQSAISDGMKKEDFLEYRNFMQYEKWKRKHHPILDSKPSSQKE